ncbi:leucine-rich repeat receptor-like kinase protein FLORAL ORGAN NUMBER1, partial [Arachis ipaensis]|uniref:leucine-rich repeat receptor-like kinase protein FLORAL ORGAN NUMBER1 n=1 Tax=Arachis ipaensis TaxID=130454 RepID=UPI000A2B9336
FNKIIKLPLLSSSPNSKFHNLHHSSSSSAAASHLVEQLLSNLKGATCNNGRILRPSRNNLSLRGTISPFLSNCTYLQSLDLSSNALTGPIPPDIQSLVNLAVLNLSSNQLQGQIPPQLTMCAYLNVIDLHDNLLTGPIPQQLGLLVRLSTFDVSNNRLSEPIPPSLSNRTGTLPRFNATSFLGNKDLYSYPLPPIKTRGLSVLAIVGIGLGSGLASLVLRFTGVCIWLKVTEHKMALDEGKISQFMPGGWQQQRRKTKDEGCEIWNLGKKIEGVIWKFY